MKNAEVIWKDIKSRTWDKFPEQRIFIDDDMFMMVMRRRDNSIVVVGFLHFKHMKIFQEPKDSKSLSFVNGVHSFPRFRDYVAKLCIFRNTKSENSDLVLLLNKKLESIDYTLLEELPKGIKYCYYDEFQSAFFHQDIEQAVKNNKETPRYTVRILPDRKFVENENVIMRALLNGEGDRFGF